MNSMISLNECLRPDTSVYLTRDRSLRKGLFYKDEKPELFIKDFNHAEFIGEELCNIKNINCVHYFLVGCGTHNLKRYSKVGNIKGDYKYNIASYDFRESDKNYKFITDYLNLGNNSLFEELLELTPNDENKKELCNDLLNLLALDIYMGQTDRVSSNFMIEEDSDNNLRLAPLFDFEYSLNPTNISNNTIYESDIISFDNINEMKKFMDIYPKFRDLLLSYLDIDLCECASRAYNSRQLKFPEDKKRYYKEFDSDRKELIKKITR